MKIEALLFENCSEKNGGDLKRRTALKGATYTGLLSYL